MAKIATRMSEESQDGTTNDFQQRPLTALSIKDVIAESARQSSPPKRREQLSGRGYSPAWPTENSRRKTRALAEFGGLKPIPLPGITVWESDREVAKMPHAEQADLVQADPARGGPRLRGVG
jgi:hypothetical protein